MGNEILGVDIAGIIGDVFGGNLLDVTVERYARGARAAGNLTGGQPVTPATITGITGFWDDFTGTPPPGIELELNDRKAILIGDTVPDGGVPARNDAITIEGQTLYVVKLLSRDPAAAVYVFLCRDRRGPDGV